MRTLRALQDILAYLASTHEVPVAPLPLVVTTKDVFKYCQMFSRGNSAHWAGGTEGTVRAAS